MSIEDSKHCRFNEYFTRLKVDDEDGSDYTDHWNSGELLCLASAVQRSGDKNWVSVSRAIKPYGEPKRPSDWYASKNCALQYSKLLKGVEDLKKKTLPRTERETSEELLVKNLTDKRLNELKYQNRLFLNVGNAIQAQLELLENGELDEHLDDMVKQMEDMEKTDKDDYREWLLKRESLNQVKRLNKCRAPISKGKAPTSRSLESRRKNSSNPDHLDHDTLHSLVADATIKMEIDSGEESPQFSKIKIKTEPDQFILTKSNVDDSRMYSPQISIPASHPAPPTSPLLTSLLRNVGSATPTTSSAGGNINSSPLKEISAEDLLLQSAKLLNNSPESMVIRKSDSQQIFLSPTPTSTSSISPLLTSLLKSPTAATPVSPISTNVVTPSLPKEVEQLEALDPLKLPGNALEAEGATIPKSKELLAQGHAASHPIPATSPLLNSLLKSPNTSISVPSSASTSPLQMLQPKEATTPKSASIPQSFFNPTSALATAAAQQLAVATASLPQNHHFFQQPEPSNGRKSVHSSPINSATLSAPTLSKLLEMPPSTPGKLPPLPVIDSPSPTTVSGIEPILGVSNAHNLSHFQTPPRSISFTTPKGLASTPPKVIKQLFFEQALQDDGKHLVALSSVSPGLAQNIETVCENKNCGPLSSVQYLEDSNDDCKGEDGVLKVEQKVTEIMKADSFPLVDSILGAITSKSKDPLDTFTFDDAEFEDAESILKAISNSTVKEIADADFDKSKIQNLGLSPSISLGSKLENVSNPIAETFSTSKNIDATEDDNGGNSKKFYKSRSTPKKRTSAEEDLIEKANESLSPLTPRSSASKRLIRRSKQNFDFNSDTDQFLIAGSAIPVSDQEENKDSKDCSETEMQSPALPTKKARLYDKPQPVDINKESNDEEATYLRRAGPGRRPKKFRGKVLKSSAKLEDPKDQYEFSESTEESSVGYQTANSLCYMPRMKEEHHFEESKIKSQDAEIAVSSSLGISKLDKKFFSSTTKTKQASIGDNVSGSKPLFVSDEEHVSDSFDIADDAANLRQLPEEKIQNWRAINEKHMESSDNATKLNLRKGSTTESPKNKLQAVKKTPSRNDKNKAVKKAKKQMKDATDSDFEELTAFSQDSEEATVVEPAWQKQGSSETNSSSVDKVKSENLISEMEVETNDSHVSSSIAAESDRQLDDMEGYESLQGSITTDFSTPPSSAKGDKERSRFGKHEWYQGASPKSSEPVSQSSEDSEYESDNSDNQSVSTNKSTSQSTEQSRIKRRERESPEYKAWKKSISIVWREISSHKYANVFLQKVTNDVAPGYLNIVNRPMDLSLIKKNIDNGVIRTTYEFMRDMMLMFQNAIMYNSSDHDVYQMAVEMQNDVQNQILDFYATQVIIKEKSGEQTTSSLRAARNAKAVSKTPQSLPKSREDGDRLKEA